MEVKIIVPKFPNGIAIGEERENLAVPVVVDYTAWIEQHGAGALQILLQRPQDADPYPVAVTNDNGEAVWTPTETDMDFKGRGEIQLVYTAGDVIEKSPVIAVISGRSLGVSGDAPDPYETWLESLTGLAAETLTNAQNAANSEEQAGEYAGQALESADEAKAAAEKAEEAVTHYPVIINGYWCVWDVTSGEYVSTGIEAQGPDGFSPTVVVTTITGGHRVTITDANGPHVFDVLDGAKGEKGDKGDKGDPLTYDDLTPAQKADLLQDTVTKESLDDAGIESYTYRTRFGGAFTVTTVATTGYLSPFARSSARGVFERTKTNRVTVNGTEYVLRTRLWYAENKIYSYIGDIGLYIGDVSGVPGGTDNVPFVIISDLNNNESIDVLTDTEGTYTVLVETITPTQKALPKSLIWDDSYVPIEKANNDSGSTYTGTSLGVNELTNKRGTFAIGYGNKVSNDFSTAVGGWNEITGKNSAAIGTRNTVGGSYAFSEGYQNTANGNYSHTEGRSNTTTGLSSHAEGYGCVVGGNYAHAEGVQTAANAQSTHAENQFTIASGQSSHAEGHSTRAQASTSHVQGAGTLAGTTDVATHIMGVNNAVEEYTGRSVSVQPYNADGTKKGDPGTLQLGKYAEIVGNGASDDERSNARTLDWSGNERLAGDLTIHAGGADETTVGEALDEIGAALDEKAPAIYKTAGPAAVVTVTDGAEGVTIKTLTVNLPALQDGSGDPSPENVRPFVARSARRVTRTGANLWGGDRWFDSGAGTFDRDARTVKSTTWQTLPQITGVKYKAQTAYTLILTMTSTATHGYPGYVWQYTDGTSVNLNDTRISTIKGTFAFTSNPNKSLLRIDRTSYSGTKTIYVDESGIFEGNLTADDFQPYMGQLVNIDWTDTAGDVYAGTLTLNADGNAELSALPHYASYAGETLVGPWVSSMDVYAEGATPTTGAEVVDLGGVATVYQLTAEQIKALGGVNNIWSNAGNVTAVYPADTKAYIDEQTAALSGEIDTLGGEVDVLSDNVTEMQSNVTDTQSMIATVETSETASRDYAVGDLLVLGGTLYKVTTAINLGSTIIPDGNVEQTTVGQQLTDVFAPAELVGSLTLTGADVPTGGATFSVPLSKPCRQLTITMVNGGKQLPQWAYIRLNYADNSPAMRVTSAQNHKSAVCIIDLIAKFGLAITKPTGDNYSDSAIGGNAVVSNKILNTSVATEIGISASTGFADGFELKIYGR